MKCMGEEVKTKNDPNEEMINMPNEKHGGQERNMPNEKHGGRSKQRLEWKYEKHSE